MAYQNPIPGKGFRLSVALTLAGTYTLVGKMNATEKTTSRSTETTDYYEGVNAYSEPGPREKSYSVNGLFVPDDPGQLMIRDAEALDTPVFIKVLPMGGSADATENVRGYTHEVRVGSKRYGAPGRGPQTWGFDLVSVNDEVITVGGYID